MPGAIRHLKFHQKSLLKSRAIKSLTLHQRLYMFELQRLKDAELNLKIKSFAMQERKLTEVILRYLAEVDRRKLYLKMAYPSIFEYLIKEIGYSAGSAQRRIDGARLLQRIPEVSSKIKAGSINLAQVSKLQMICRRVKKESGSPVQISIQKEVLKKLENQGSLQTDLILAKEFQTEIKVFEKRSIQRDESIRVELTFSKKEMEILKKAQELLSNKTGGGLKATILEMAEKVIKASEARRIQDTKPATINHESKQSNATVAVDLSAKIALGLKTITPRLRNEIFRRDQCCGFKDSKTGKSCGSKYFLEIDHIQPRFAEGSNAPDNLRLLCRNHNQFRCWAGL